jgi:hypothetical protein
MSLKTVKGEEEGGGRGEDVLDGLRREGGRTEKDKLEFSPRLMHWYCAPIIASVPLFPRSCFGVAR